MDDATQIINVIGEYAHAVADERWDDWAALFHPDGRVVLRGHVYRGTADLRAFIEASHRGRDPAKVFSANLKLDIKDDEARVVSDFLLLRSKEPDTFVIASCGRYRDIMVRGSGGWRFVERRIEPMHEAGPADSTPPAEATS